MADQPAGTRREGPLDLIVYQFGKVGSTSVVRTLSRMPGVRPHQAHFLGEDALRSKLHQLLGHTLHPHFLEHGERQLIQNVRLTRLFNSYRSGAGEGRMAIVTIVREPLDWFRSQFVQDYPGYEPGLRAIVGALDDADDFDIQGAVETLRQAVVAALGFGGGLSNPDFRSTLHREYLPILQAAQGKLAAVYIDHIAALLRPFYWFHDAVRPLLGIDLKDIRLDQERFFACGCDWGEYYVFRYEELAQGFTRFLDELGLPPIGLDRENLSETKPKGSEIQAAFASWFADQDLKVLLKSEYTSTFGYEEYEKAWIASSSTA